MGIRVTGISTPVGGLSWEYTRSDKQNIPLIISPGQKIKVFISSICGVEKYDKVRAELKSAIEATQLADAYTFESKGASTLTAGDHYTFALEESDICIFLIDNADGIRPRVQGEIDTVKKYNIKALYYFCDENQKEKTALELLAFGSVGYFLDDECYERYEKSIVDEIKLWLNSDNPVVVIGENIFKCLSGVSYRMSQDMLSEICCQFIDKHYSRWYTDMFKFIANHIDLREMSNDSANELVRHINCVLDNEKEREQIKYSPLFLCVLRRQNYAITEEMDKKIAEYLPSYYGDTYRLEITENENEDMPGFVREYAERIRKSNETQGKNGIFFGHGTREIATVRAILLEKEFVCDSEIIDVLISTVADTLLIFKGKYRYKT